MAKKELLLEGDVANRRKFGGFKAKTDSSPPKASDFPLSGEAVVIALPPSNTPTSANSAKPTDCGS